MEQKKTCSRNEDIQTAERLTFFEVIQDAGADIDDLIFAGELWSPSER